MYKIFTESRKRRFLMRVSFVYIFLMLSGIQLLSANTGRAQGLEDIMVTIDVKQTNLEYLLKRIEFQTDLTFAYLPAEVNKYGRISIESGKQSVKSALDNALKTTDLSYRYIENSIILFPKSGNKKSPSNVHQRAGNHSVAISADNIILRRHDQTVDYLSSKDLIDVYNKRLVLDISGQVVDANNEPLIGVNVQVKGTNKGTATDIDGRFSFSDIDDKAILVVSYIGYKSQEVAVDSQTSLTIVMQEDVQTLDEVVVVGYGKQKKSDLTGAVSAVKGDLIGQQSMQLSQGLQGLLPGVMVTRNGNKPGSEASIRVRGITTINNSSPLYIIDGVPGDINDINPQDIENISVLKDGASAAIYGSRAASGVILVETKRATTGSSSLSYEMNFGVETPTRLPEYVGAVRSMQLYNESVWNDRGNKGDEYPTFSKELIDDYPRLNAEDPYQYPDYDWQANGVDDHAPTQSHQITYMVGSDKIKTRASVGFNKSHYLYNGLTENEASFQRINGRVNNDLVINDYLSGTIDLNISRSIDEKGPDTKFGRPADNTVIPFNPIYRPFWEDGRPTETRGGWNSHAVLRYGGHRTEWRNRIGGKVSLNIKPIEGMKISAILSPDYLYSKEKNWRKKVPYYNRDNPTENAGYVFRANSTDLKEYRVDDYSITSQFLINYQTNIGNNNIDILAGYENFYRYNENLSAISNQYELSLFPYLDRGNENFLANTGNASEVAYRSYFTRINYSFKNKYLAQANLRYDGSSRFHKDHRWGAFPSLSVGWVLTEETFFGDNKIIDFLKLRGSWGILGNDRIGRYPYQSTIDFGSNLFYQSGQITSVLNSRVQNFAIEDISWETTESYNVGIDVYLFDSRLNLSGDYYRKTTRDMLLALEIPDYMGVSNPDQNTGNMYTNGWDIQLGYNHSINKFNFSITANLSDFKSKMGDLGGTEFLGDRVNFEGSEFNEWYGFKSEGLFQTEEELTSTPVLNPTVRTGDIKLIDISGSDEIPDGKISPDHDRVLLGGSLPRYQYGGTIRMEYKSLDINFTFQGIGKQNSMIDPWMVKHHGENAQEIPRYYADNYWSIYNSEQQNQNALYPRFTTNGYDQMFTFSDFWMFNGAYFRLKNVVLGYNIPGQLASNIGMQDARIYANISNLFSIDNYFPGWDPEATPNSYWMTKSFRIGLSLTF